MSNMYDILGKLKSVFSTEAPAVETPAQPIYESVEPRGSISEAVKSLEAKFQTFKESAKPDFLDVDKDGNKKEPFKKAVKDKKAVEEGTIAKPKKDLRKHSATAKRMAMQKKADKGHEEWLDHLEKTDPDHPSLKYRKQATNEGAGPYELYNPKHPKFKANYEKYKAKHPDCTLAEFVAAMKKKEHEVNEGVLDQVRSGTLGQPTSHKNFDPKTGKPLHGQSYANAANAVRKAQTVGEGEYDPEPIDPEAVAKRKRLQAIKDRQEEQGDDYSNSKSNVRKIPGKAYGGAAQKDDADDLDEVVRVQPKGNMASNKFGGANQQSQRTNTARSVKDTRALNRKTGGPTKGAASGEYDAPWSDKVSTYNNPVTKAFARPAAQGKGHTGLGEESPPAGFTDPGEKGATFGTPVVTPAAAAAQASAPPAPTGPAPVMPTATSTPTTLDSSELDEKAPPGAKAERMVKHIKKGYSKDGNLTNKEKAIAYATAWKAKKAGVVEATEFKDTIKNSTPNMKKTKLVKESRVMEETDYFYEKVGKALAEKNPTLDTAGDEFYDAVRKEMVAQGIPPNRARNILTMDEDFLMDVASSYGHYCKDIAECGAPINSQLGGTEELDEIAKLAGLPTKQATCEACGMLESSCSCTHESALGAVAGGIAGAALGKTPAAARVGAAIGDQLTDESVNDDERQLDHYHELVKQGMDPDEAEMIAFNDEGDEELDEADMAEGNEFSGALAAAKASGAKEFEVDGKKYTVKEDINVNITANGQEDALNLFRKLAGMDEVHTSTNTINPVNVDPAPALPQDAESAIAQGIVEPVEVEVDEERNIEYTNTPNEKIGPIGAAIPNGDDMHKAKKSYSDKPYRGDNPMAVKEAALWAKYESMINDIKK